MTPERSQELVVGCLAASLAMAAGSQLADGETPGIRFVVGAGVTAIGLATVSMFAPDIAGTFSALILTTTFFVYSKPLMDLISTLTTDPADKTPTANHGNPHTGVVTA